MATFDELARAIAALPDSVYRVFDSRTAPATAAELADLERRIGWPLDAEHRALLAAWGVLVVEVVEAVWPRVQEYEVGPAWKGWHGFRVLGLGAKLSMDLTIDGALTPELTALGAVPVLQRFGARWLGVAVADGAGTWAPGDPAIERSDGNVIELILAEIRSLEHGVATLTAKAAPVESLLAKARAAGWSGVEVGQVIDELKERAASEIGPHLAELCDALLEEGTHSMGVLDVIAAAGPDSFAAVADRVYAHYARSDAEYVIELLGKVRDVSPGAIALYRDGFASDDSGVRERTVGVLIELSALPEIRALVPMVEAASTDPARATDVLGLLQLHGSPAFVPTARAALAAAADEGAVAKVIGTIRGPAETVAPLVPDLLARLQSLRPDKPGTFNTIAALCALGIEDRAMMEPIVRAFHAKGAAWAKRAEPLLARWT